MNKLFSRRDFITATTASCLALQLPAFAVSAMKGKTVKFGMITDLHQDIMHDGLERMQTFVQHMKHFKPDALLQLGDFAYPGEKNKAVIDLFNQAHRETIHVIGNHDVDGGFTKQDCISYWGMPSRYYVRQVGGISLIVLDGNDQESPDYKGGYPAYINHEQQQWLKEQLAIARKPVVILSHQPIAGPYAIDNAVEVQAILSAASGKILLAINGHTHIDTMLTIDKVHYVHLNSASYFWAGDNFRHETYPAEILKTHPWISRTCPYKNALFATMTIDPVAGKVMIEGTKSEWVGSSPEQLGYFQSPSENKTDFVMPAILNRSM